MSSACCVLLTDQTDFNLLKASVSNTYLDMHNSTDYNKKCAAPKHLVGKKRKVHDLGSEINPHFNSVFMLLIQFFYSIRRVQGEGSAGTRNVRVKRAWLYHYRSHSCRQCEKWVELVGIVIVT